MKLYEAIKHYPYPARTLLVISIIGFGEKTMAEIADQADTSTESIRNAISRFPDLFEKRRLTASQWIERGVYVHSTCPKMYTLSEEGIEVYEAYTMASE